MCPLLLHAALSPALPTTRYTAFPTTAVHFRGWVPERRAVWHHRVPHRRHVCEHLPQQGPGQVERSRHHRGRVAACCRSVSVVSLPDSAANQRYTAEQASIDPLPPAPPRLLSTWGQSRRRVRFGQLDITNTVFPLRAVPRARLCSHRVANVMECDTTVE